MLLAILRSQTVGSTPVLEEAVQTSTVLEYAGAVDDSETPCLRAVVVNAVSESRVGVSWVRSEGDQRIRIGLEVGCLVLYGAHKDIRCVRELIVV
jgi:hypothetical protein